MPTEYSPVATTYHETITRPSGSDRRNEVFYAAGLEDLADNAAFLRNRVPGAVPHKREVVLERGRTETGWLFNPSQSLGVWRQTANGQTLLRFPISDLIPYVSKISWFGAVMQAASGHGSTWPQNGSIVRLARYLRTGSYMAAAEVVDFVAPYNNGSTTIPGYEQVHTLQKNLDTPHAYNSNYLYFLEVVGENGTGYVEGLAIQALSFEVAS